MNNTHGAIGPYFLDNIYCADALRFMRWLPDNCIDLVVTSPPYDNLRTYNGYSFDFEGIAHEAYRVIKPGGVMVWVVGDSVVNGSETLTSMRQAIYFVDTVGFRMHDTMIYGKDGMPFPDTTRYYQNAEFMFVLSKGAPKTVNLQRTKTTHTSKTFTSQRNADGSITPMKYGLGKETRVLSNIWLLGTGYMKTTKDKKAFDHPAMFPEELARRHIVTWSNPGDLVLDFMSGSGTTCKMARNTGRHYLGCDVSLEYVTDSRTRLAQPFMPDMFITQDVQAATHKQRVLFD